MAAAVILLSIVAFGGAAAFVAWRNPDRPWSRTLGVVVSIPAIGAGGWLALLDVGIGGRLVGGIVCALGIAALVRAARKG